MKSSDKDRQLDQALTDAVPDDPPTPDFETWLQKNQEAVDILQTQAQYADDENSRTRTRSWSIVGRVIRIAALIIIVLGLGFWGGRLSAVRDSDIHQLRAELEASLGPSIAATLKNETFESLNQQWQVVFAANAQQLRREILQQLRQDLDDVATQTLAASKVATDKRVTELIQLIESTRVRDYQRIGTALQQIELNRRRDRVQLGSGLLTLAARTNEQTDTRTN
jgi:hypothetical protein